MIRVLVLDDDDDVRTTVVDILLSDGYFVDSAGTCEEALALIEAAPPDVILLDIRFENGASGVDFARCYLNRPPPHARLVLFSALPQAPEIATQIRASAVLPKPFHVRQLLDTVAQHSAPNTALPARPRRQALERPAP